MKNFSKFYNTLLKTTILLSCFSLASAVAATTYEEETSPGCDLLPKVEIKLKTPNSVSLEVGEAHEWEITNQSLKAAYQIKLNSLLLDEGKIIVEDPNSCNFLGALKTCKIKTTAKESGEGKVTFKGCNTNRVEGNLKINGGNQLMIGDGEGSCYTINSNRANLKLTNLSNANITFTPNDIRFEGLKDVKADEYYSGAADECKFQQGKWTVPAGADNSCVLPLEAGKKAYNTTDDNGKVFIKYQDGQQTRESEGCVNVSDVKVSINGGETITVPTGSYDDKGKKEVIVRNESKHFFWQNAKTEFVPGSIENVTTSTRKCLFDSESTDDAVGPGDCVVVTFETTSSDAHGKGELLATGSNITPNPTIQEVKVGDVTITLAGEDKQRLQLQTIRVSNNFATGPVRLRSVTWSGLDDEIKLCSEFDFTCAERSTCKEGVDILPNQSCDIVLEAVDNFGQSLRVNEGTVEVRVTSSYENHINKEWVANFHASRETSLYVTGFFDTAGKTVAANNIAKWNGRDWSNLATGLQGEGYALAVFQGDLHVGGRYASADSAPNTMNLAKWNGSSWSQLGSQPYLTPNGPVRMLYATDDSQLNVGGEFTVVDDVAARHIAQWNGSSWTALGGLANNGTDGPIYDITAYLGGLYFAGDFEHFGVPRENRDILRSRANNVVGYVDYDWKRLGHIFFNGTNKTVYSLYTANDNDLYVAGEFKRVLGNRTPRDPTLPVTRANHIAKWSASKWQTVGKNQFAINGTVRDVTSFHDTLFIGGSFNNAFEGLRYVAFLNGADGNWVQAGVAIDGDVHHLLPTATALYAGGHFGASGGLFNNIAYLDRVNQATNWKPVDFDGGGVTLSSSPEEATVKSMLIVDSLRLR